MRNVRLMDNITNFYYKIVECCLVLKKIFEKIISILQFSNFERKKKFMASHLDNFWENFGNSISHIVFTKCHRGNPQAATSMTTKV